jgi:TrmH family RNA methyltransferase
MTIRKETITSRNNRLLKQLRRAASRGALTANGFALAESPHLLNEALRSGVEIERVFASERTAIAVAGRIPPHRRIPLHVLADRLFDDVATTTRNQGVLALVKLPYADPTAAFAGLTLVLDGIQDPGNAGTMARSAEAFGASGVVFLKGSAAPTNPKALRAAAGSLFRLPVLQGIDAGALPNLARQHGKTIFAAVARGGVSLPDADISRDAAVVIGSETHGVAPVIAGAATPIAIPTKSVESLNAAAAAAVIMYEFWRRGLPS